MTQALLSPSLLASLTEEELPEEDPLGVYKGIYKADKRQGPS